MSSQVFASLVVYDMLFWASHLAIHRIPWLYRIVHAKHHRRRTMRARETVALSVADEALDVACSIAALNVLNVHPLSRCAAPSAVQHLVKGETLVAECRQCRPSRHTRGGRNLRHRGARIEKYARRGMEGPTQRSLRRGDCLPADGAAQRLRPAVECAERLSNGVRGFQTTHAAPSHGQGLLPGAQRHPSSRLFDADAYALLNCEAKAGSPDPPRENHTLD